ncbi:MAG TPA: hypothetical protein VJP77_06895, partial [Planctomycetota bacterium]|nr:hypothetical protein [Planctomycetota bacterium]
LPVPGLGTLNVAGTAIVIASGVADAGGRAVLGVPVPAGFPAGVSGYAQFFALDGLGLDLLSASAGLEVVTQ